MKKLKVKCCKIYPYDERQSIDGESGMHIVVESETEDFIEGCQVEHWRYYGARKVKYGLLGFRTTGWEYGYRWELVTGGYEIGDKIDTINSDNKYRRGDRIIISKKNCPILRFYNAEINLTEK